MPSDRIRQRFDARARESPGEYWYQVARTIGGVPVEEGQVAMALDAIRDALELRSSDVVVDLGCGNGALSRRVFEGCAGGLGVDFAEAMIAEARAAFEVPGRYEFAVGDVETFVARANEVERFTKGLFFFAFAHLPPDAAEVVLRGLRTRFTTLQILFVGDLPDKARVHDFYYPEHYVAGIENDYEAPLGLWRTAEEFVELGRRTGWSVEIRQMPAEYHAAHYRYNAVLRPAPE